MSVQALTQALKCQLDNPGAKLVLLVLANYANEQNVSYPSLEHLQQVTGIRRRTLFIHLNFLEERKLITRDHRRSESGQYFSNIYKLTIEDPPYADSAYGDPAPSVDIRTPPSADSAPYTKERDTKENTHNGVAEFEWPLKPLIKAFPHLTDRLTPAQCGQIDAEVTPYPENIRAWKETIELYSLNYDPMRKMYLPEKVGNLLSTFRSIRDKNLKPQKLGTSDKAKRNGGFLH